MKPVQNKAAWPVVLLVSLLGSGLAFYSKIDAVCASEEVPFLPYHDRTRPYSGWSTTVRGDIRTVGMAGATTGLGDTFMAASDNPAGLAMTMKNGDTNFTSNSVRDENIQKHRIEASSLGLALNSYPWGFSIGKATPWSEGQVYRLDTAPLDPVALMVSIDEYRLSAGRVFFDDHLALGVGLKLGVLEERIDFAQSTELNSDQSATAVGATFGAMYRFPQRLILGASYSLPMDFPLDPLQAPTTRLTGFYQPVQVPWRIGTGLGWIPNRFFRADFTTHFVGTTPGTGLIRDQSVEVGQRMTVHPRLGAAYVFADFRNSKGTVFTGTYYEASRVAGAINRFHYTAGIEVKLWIFNIGFGVDAAADFRNYITGVGIDPFALMTKLGLIPKTDNERLQGVFPSPMRRSDEGLTRPLVANWNTAGPDVNPVDIGLKIPGKIGKGVKKMTDKNIKDVGSGLLDAIESIPEAIGEEFEHMKKTEEESTTAPKPAEPVDGPR